MPGLGSIPKNSGFVNQFPNFIGVDISGDKRIAKLLEKLPDAIADDIVPAIAEYLVNVYQIYPPKKKITRKQAFGRTFQSEKQRRYFFWALGKGIIRTPYKRTQQLRNAWRIVGSDRNAIVVNQTLYAEFVMGDEHEQSKMMNMIGWEHAGAVPALNKDKIDKIIVVEAKKAAKKLGLIIT